MASAASALPCADSAAASLGSPAAMGAMSMDGPMTPVEATTTSAASMPSASAVKAHMASAFSMPSNAQVLAMPLLQTMARALPSAICACVTVSGAPLTRLRVYTAAADAGRSDTIRPRSFLARFFRMPQCTPAA